MRSTRGRDPRLTGGDDVLAVMVLVVGGVGVGALLLVWAGAALAAAVAGAPVPAFSVDSAIATLRWLGDPTEHGPSAGLSRLLVLGGVASVVIVAGTAAWLCRGWWGGLSSPAASVAEFPGTASRAEVRATVGEKALMRRAHQLRPSVRTPTPADVGQHIGESRGVEVWTTVEDSKIVVGPPRAGKGLLIVIPTILDAPGAVVTTSTRPENLTATLTARSRVGPVAVFDPQRLAPGVAAGLRWSPVRGCEDPHTAMIRARGLAAGTGMGGGGVENGDFWKGQTETALRGLLHAAALGQRNAADLYRWSLDPVAAGEAFGILSSSPVAARGWAEALEAASTADPRTRDSIWLGVRQALSALADPRVLDAVNPDPGEQFDPATFIREKGSLYLLGTASGAGAAGPLVSALIEDMMETARSVAAASPSARLDPPLTLVLDEIANVAMLESLPSLVSEGGGSGITTTAVFQSLAQARGRWGEQLAAAIWDASNVKIILGGSGNAKDLQDLSALVGDRDDETVSVSRGPAGEATRQVSYRRVPIIDSGQLRKFPFGTAVLMLRSASPMVLTMRPWTERPDAEQIKAERNEVESLIGRAFRDLHRTTTSHEARGGAGAQRPEREV